MFKRFMAGVGSLLSVAGIGIGSICTIYGVLYPNTVRYVNTADTILTIFVGLAVLYGSVVGLTVQEPRKMNDNDLTLFDRVQAQKTREEDAAA
jgi:hypothetical protein